MWFTPMWCLDSTGEAGIDLKKKKSTSLNTLLYLSLRARRQSGAAVITSLQGLAWLLVEESGWASLRKGCLR